jgi:hypothetical protein
MAWRNKEEEKLERRQEQASVDRTGAQPGEKPKKTWKEVDAQRDGSRSGSRRDEPRPAKRESFAYKSYKSKLDNLFDGKIKMSKGPEVEFVGRAEPEVMVKPAAAPEPEEPLTPKDLLKRANTAAAIAAAARACLDAGGLPRDAELLGKVLEAEDPSLIGAALDVLLDVCERGRPKNAKALRERIVVLAPTLTDPVARDIAAGLIARFA